MNDNKTFALINWILRAGIPAKTISGSLGDPDWSCAVPPPNHKPSWAHVIVTLLLCSTVLKRCINSNVKYHVSLRMTVQAVKIPKSQTLQLQCTIHTTLEAMFWEWGCSNRSRTVKNHCSNAMWDLIVRLNSCSDFLALKPTPCSPLHIVHLNVFGEGKQLSFKKCWSLHILIHWRRQEDGLINGLTGHWNHRYNHRKLNNQLHCHVQHNRWEQRLKPREELSVSEHTQWMVCPGNSLHAECTYLRTFSLLLNWLLHNLPTEALEHRTLPWNKFTDVSWLCVWIRHEREWESGQELLLMPEKKKTAITLPVWPTQAS